MNSTKIHVAISSLICHRKGKATGWRKTAPYMWNIFFKLCHPHLTITPKFTAEGKAVFHFTEGSHGNLGVGHLEDGARVSIPSEIGQWIAEVADIQVPFFNYSHPGIVGCICVLMEQHNVTNKGAEAGHQSLNNYVRQSMNQAIKDFNVGAVDVKSIEPSIKQYIDGEINTFTDGIEQRVGGAVMQAQSLVQNIWSLLDKDELIGYHIWHFNSEELLAHPNGVPLQARWASYDHGDWEVMGTVRILGA